MNCVADDGSFDKGYTRKQYSAPPEYLERRKQERERRRSETGIRQKLKKGARKSDGNANVDVSVAQFTTIVHIMCTFECKKK